MAVVTPDNHYRSFAQRLSAILSYIVFGLGLWGLLGWKFIAHYLDSETIKLVIIAPVACVSCMLTGMALWAFQEKRSERFKRLGTAASGLVLVLSGFSLSDYFFSFEWELETAVLALLGAENAIPVLFSTVITATAGLFIIAAAILLLRQRQAAWHMVAHAAVTIVGMVGLASLIGYLYDFTPRYFSMESRWIVTLPAAVALMCASLATLLLRPDRGLVPVFLGGGVSGFAARRFLLFSVTVPFVIGALIAYARRITTIPAEESILLFAVAIILLSFILVYWNSLALSRVEEVLRESEQRYRSIFENAVVGMFTTSLDGKIIAVNPAVARMTGYASPQEMKNLVYDIARQIYLHPEDRAKFIELIQRSEGRPVSFEAWFRRKDGGGFLGRMDAWLVRDQGGKATHLEGFVEDITERRKAEEAMKAANRELEQFAYVASHDLQEPLRMVASFTELLERRYRKQFDEKGQKYLNYIVSGASRMQDLIQDLLTFSRIGRLDTERSRVDLNIIVDSVIADLSGKIREAQAEVTHNPLPSLEANQSSMGRLFMNLIGNAIKFRKKDIPPKVHLTAQRSGNEWRFAVSDNGIGIDPRYYDKIFVIFQRLHSREEYPGTGMGLAISKKIVENYGGRIWVESEPGKGSTFYFTIPR